MKKLSRKVLGLVGLMIVLSGFVGYATATVLNGVYFDGTAGRISHYTNNVLDWQYPVEGNYTQWTYQWVNTEDVWLLAAGQIFVSKTADTLIEYSSSNICYMVMNLTDGTRITDSVSMTSGGGAAYDTPWSLEHKYFAYTALDGSSNVILHIFKDNAEVQQIDLTATRSWTSGGYMMVAVSPSGEYILVTYHPFTTGTEAALYQGA